MPDTTKTKTYTIMEREPSGVVYHYCGYTLKDMKRFFKSRGLDIEINEEQ